jgi:hypothetical protein
MRNKFSVVITSILSVALLPSTVMAQTIFLKSVAVMTAPDRHGPDGDKVAEALRECAVELRVAYRPMPRIVLLVAGKNEARIADVNDWSHVFIENHDSGKTVYMAWIVENVANADLLQLFTAILNDEFRLGMTPEQAKAVSRHLAMRKAATISVNSLLSANK